MRIILLQVRTLLLDSSCCNCGLHHVAGFQALETIQYRGTVNDLDGAGASTSAWAPTPHPSPNFNMGKLALEAMPRFKLNNGTSIPAVGLGTWQSEPGLVGQAVKEAVKVGYRHIDCAKDYNNEKEVGDALQELYRDGIVKREDLWITTKLWNADHNDVAEALDESIEKLQCGYVDLYLIHWPVALKKDTTGTAPENFAPLNVKATWTAMEKCYESGKAKAMGVSNFSVEKTKDLLSYCKVRPAVNQVECHPLWQQKKLWLYLKSESIHLTAYSPIGSSNSPFASINVLELPTITKLAKKYGKSPAQIALRWNVQQGHSVLPKSTHNDRLATSSFSILKSPKKISSSLTRLNSIVFFEEVSG